MRLKASTAIALITFAAAPAFAQGKAEVLDTYADIAQAGYEDSLTTAQTLQAAVETLIASPSAEALQAAKTAWLAARVPYQQTEVFRFGNAIVDDWEGKVNAWPLDEGLIDYVDASYGGETDENQLAVLNVIANPTFTLGGEEVDATEITPELLEGQLQEAGAVEANVATGYHAIEFLLWGQDLNGTDHGAGDRPWTDYAAGDDCTGGNCDRRGQYLKAATDLLVSDLEWMAGQWAEGGEARATVLADEDAGIDAILTGMGSLSYGEQAGERMKLGVMLNDPEEEHDCFSDNTHNSHYYDGLGVRNVYLGEYLRVDGRVVSGASLSDLVASADAGVDEDLRAKLNASMVELGQIKTAAEAGFSYDMMLERGNAEGEALIMGAVDALVNQTRAIERAVTALGGDEIAFEGSDSLDAPEAVFQ
ncbi:MULTISPECIES: imelysin family protein [Sulfitobacter]|uniref:imelysin family protein n=1 Tax=Sulfitobacter TaxID=60136 RepID=UPI0023079811|nr:MULTISPECIES: imelysin family protein [Sulfitobacter]MDF3382047.1 peptidase [Sulfitobacter sp. Ks11]MDF3385466.1 peptidase [Sulfitobacter sp. M85]MDF3388885.1 peptidase [Sulfitobacter sp. Ks16]MDF3399522.1 peptidase [Sulfitobacter sp. KE39]MDF3402943.1 peptidase [Sulfitobacter sp. Ks35]